MGRRSIVPVTLERLPALPAPCGCCGFWENREPASLDIDFAAGNTDKKDWYENVLTHWGSCGRLVLEAEQALAYAQYAPADFFPQLQYYALGPVSPDAIFLSCLFVPDRFRGRGLGKLLVNTVQKDLIKRGYRAVETFARRAPAKNPSGWTEFYLANGWQVIRESSLMSLLRLDLRTVVSWQINLDSVLESLSIPVPRQAKMPVPG
ncbi:MAG: GNAT family N-acetyltransferase [Actinomycetota bacterium]|nr:GNAT family N-acetyltransferase [Actinomycetota bacterium]